ncbi:NlpC-P60 family protein, partial [Xanthomonas oryzae pv. oryzae]
MCAWERQSPCGYNAWMWRAPHATIDVPAQLANSCLHPELCMPLSRRLLIVLLIALALPCS